MKTNQTESKDKRFEFRLSNELSSQFKEYCTKHDLSQSEAIRNILEEKLNNTSPELNQSTEFLIFTNKIFNLALSNKNMNKEIRELILKEVHKDE